MSSLCSWAAVARRSSTVSGPHPALLRSMLTRSTTSSASDEGELGVGADVVVVARRSLVVVVVDRPDAPERPRDEPPPPGRAASTDPVAGWPTGAWDAARSAADPVSCTSSSDVVPTREWTNTGPRQAMRTNATSRGTDGCRRVATGHDLIASATGPGHAPTMTTQSDRRFLHRVSPITTMGTGALTPSGSPRTVRERMTEIFLIGLIAVLAMVVVARVLDRLLDFDELSACTKADSWRAGTG